MTGQLDCENILSQNIFTCPVRRRPLVVAVIMTAAKEEVRRTVLVSCRQKEVVLHFILTAIYFHQPCSCDVNSASCEAEFPQTFRVASSQTEQQEASLASSILSLDLESLRRIYRTARFGNDWCYTILINFTSMKTLSTLSLQTISLKVPYRCSILDIVKDIDICNRLFYNIQSRPEPGQQIC